MYRYLSDIRYESREVIRGSKKESSLQDSPPAGALLRHKKTAVLPDDRQMGNPIFRFTYLNLISFPSSLHCLNSADADNRRSEEEFRAVSTES